MLACRLGFAHLHAAGSQYHSSGHACSYAVRCLLNIDIAAATQHASSISARMRLPEETAPWTLPHRANAWRIPGVTAVKLDGLRSEHGQGVGEARVTSAARHKHEAAAHPHMPACINNSALHACVFPRKLPHAPSLTVQCVVDP